MVRANRRSSTLPETTMNFRRLSIASALLIASICPLRAEEGLVAYKSLTPELALDLARAALDSCRTRGYQVAVAVVDRFGVTQVMLGDRFAGPHTPSTAARRGQLRRSRPARPS